MEEKERLQLYSLKRLRAFILGVALALSASCIAKSITLVVAPRDEQTLVDVTLTDVEIIIPKADDRIEKNLAKEIQQNQAADVALADATKTKEEQQEAPVNNEGTRSTTATDDVVSTKEETLKEKSITREATEELSNVTALLPPPQPLPDPIRLLRAPKAGSSSFSAFLRAQYQCHTEKWGPGDCNKKSQFYCGAIHGCWDHKTPPDWKNDETVPPIVTTIREPIVRYISSYQYRGHHGKGTNGNITLHTILFPEYDNTLTNFLSRNTVGTWNVPDRKGNEPRSEPPDPSKLPSPKEMERRLQEAVDLMNSEKLAFIGLVEYFNDSLRLFCRIYVCPALEESLRAEPMRKVSTDETYSTKNYPYSDPSAMQAIQNSNAFDKRLYQVAVARFCQDLLRYESDSDFMSSLQPETLSMCKSIEKSR